MTPPAILSTEKRPLSKVAVEMDKFSMVTMLLQATVTLRHRDEDLTLWAFRPTHSSGHISGSDPKFTTLEAFNALLTPNEGVVAACYLDEEPLTMPHVHKEGCIDDPVLDSDKQKYMMPCHIVVMANADKETNALETNSNPLNLRFITDGEDLWPKIKESQANNYDPLDIIAPGPGESVSLGSHAKTVCSYLNDFKAASSDLKGNPKGDDQMGYGRKFFNYLLSFCWEKLHRRFTSWPGLGFVYHLELTWLKLENSDAINEYSQWESFDIPHTGDNSLTKFLKKHDFIPVVLDAILTRGRAFETASFRSLMGAVQNDQHALFTKNTAKDFHRLVLGTFIMLTAELEQFKTHYRNWKQLDANARNTAMQSFRRIGLYTRLLLNILASTSFRTYMMFMAQGGVKNLVPVFEDRSSYDSKWKLRKSVLMGGPSSAVTPIEGEIANVEEPSDEEAEVDLEALGPNEDDVSVLVRWIRGFLLQFIGKRHLEQKCTKMHAHFPKSTIEIAVMTTDRVHYSIPQWSEFKSLIDDALQTCPDRPAKYNTSFVVARLLEEFGKKRKTYRRSVAYIDHFRKLIDYESQGESSKPKLTVSLTVHCEAALVALSEAFRESKDISTLKLNSSMVAVPKPCCPVCWELIALLRSISVTKGTDDSSPRLAIRGSHPQIYPLVLPPWISDEIRGRMNLKFRSYLGAELVQLMAILDAKQVVARPAKAKALTEAVDKKIVYRHQLTGGPNLGLGSASRNRDDPFSSNAVVLSDRRTAFDFGLRSTRPGPVQMNE
ncbi:hypothetical protein F5887DRAFT_985724 [Amanita rubescens]|nr:hypothetical protein F5887DRAFT_985724 [Amanita rubescens]